MRWSIVLARAGVVSSLIACTTTVAAIDLDPLNLFDKGAAAGRKIWRGTSGPLVEGGMTVANAVLDSGGDLVAYDVVRDARSVLRATVANGMLSVGKKTVVTFKNAGKVVGTVTVDEAGKLSGAVASGFADAAYYVYENGAIVVKDLASLSCKDLARLVGGGGNAKIDVKSESSLGTCGANVVAGFVCAVPEGLQTLVTSSVELASSISEAAASDKICRTVLVPPAYEVCGTVSLLAHQVETASKCLLKTVDLLKAKNPSMALTEGKCRDIGSFAFKLVLDVVSRSSAVKNMPKRIAELLSIVMDAADMQEKVSSLGKLPDECTEKALAQTTLPAVDKVTLYTGKYDGKSMVVTKNLPSLPEGFEGEITSIRVPASTTVALWSDTGYRGVCDSFGADVKSMALSDIGNNRLSSVRLGERCPGSPQWAMYKDSKFTGRRVELSKDIPNLATIGFDDEMTSIRSLGGGFGVTLWSEPHYGGFCYRPSVSEEKIPKPMGNDRVSSIRVGRGIQCPAEAIRVYEDTKFKDTEHVFHGDIPDAKAAKVKNTSSLKVLGGTAALYKGAWYTGQCLTVKGELTSMPSGWNDKVQSIRVHASCEKGYEPGTNWNALVTYAGHCLTALPDGSVVTQACTAAGTGQRWRSNAGGQLLNDSGRCLATERDKTGTRGTAVYVKACDIYSVAERWTFNKDYAPAPLVNFEGHAVQLAQPWQEGSAVQLGWQDDTELNQLFRPSLDRAFRPVSPSIPGETLRCGFEQLRAPRTFCASGTETLEFPKKKPNLGGANVFPVDDWLANESMTLPHRDAHAPGDGSFTLSLWFGTPFGSKSMALVDKMTDKLGYELVAQNGKLVFRIGDGTSVAAVQTAMPTDAKWHHVLAVFDRKAGKVVGWLDGKSAGWSPGGAGATTDVINGFKSVAPTVAFALGRPGTTPVAATAAIGPFEGTLDELRVYRRALSETEIVSLAKAR